LTKIFEKFSSFFQVTKVDDQLEIKAYYAGHVLGAAMFQIRVGSQSLVYTGDYNMTPDRHLVKKLLFFFGFFICKFVFFS